MKGEQKMKITQQDLVEFTKYIEKSTTADANAIFKNISNILKKAFEKVESIQQSEALLDEKVQGILSVVCGLNFHHEVTTLVRLIGANQKAAGVFEALEIVNQDE